MATRPSFSSEVADRPHVSDFQTIATREADHRISNCLQLLTGLIRMQEREMKSGEARAALADTRRRIMCMGRLHRNLCARNEQETHVALDTFLNQIGEDLSASFIDQQRVQLLVNADPVLVTPPIAHTLGLVVNELVMNAIKHGYSDGQQGVIEVMCGFQASGQLELQVTNDLPPNLRLVTESHDSDTQSGGLGHKMIMSLLDQHGGELQVDYRDRRIIHKAVLPVDAKDIVYA